MCWFARSSNRSDGTWFTGRMEVGLPTCAIRAVGAESGGVIAALNEDQERQFAGKCRENFRVRWRIISVSFLALLVMIVFVIRDPTSENAGTEMVQWLCAGTLLFSVVFLIGQNVSENRCPACQVWVGRRKWPHPDRGTMRFCAKCGVDWFPSTKDRPS